MSGYIQRFDGCAYQNLFFSPTGEKSISLYKVKEKKSDKTKNGNIIFGSGGQRLCWSFYPEMKQSVHFLKLLDPDWSRMDTGEHSSRQGGRVHPGQVPSPSQSQQNRKEFN